MASRFVILFAALAFSFTSFAQSSTEIEEINPHDPNIEQVLEEFDQIYEEEMGVPATINQPFYGLFNLSTKNNCYRINCTVWAQIVKSSQTMYLYENGVHVYTWAVSTGVRGSTPNFDIHPNGRIYDRYTSTRYPGGNYRGLGNMPYAVFFKGGFAIHGTPEGNWKKLGTPASHGCIRLHPDNAYYFNRLVRQVGIRNVWITVQP